VTATPELSPTEVPQRQPIRDIVAYFLRLGTIGFGGPVALVGQMERELVGGKAWVTRQEMRDAIAVSQSLPGPLAIQVGIFIAYMRGGFWGAWAGGWAFILPNFGIVAALGALYVYFGGLNWMTAIFYGVSPAVIALILHSPILVRHRANPNVQGFVKGAYAAAIGTILGRFTISFDGKQLFTTVDSTFTKAGKVALWTKADSVTHFDTIAITPLE